MSKKRLISKSKLIYFTIVLVTNLLAGANSIDVNLNVNTNNIDIISINQGYI